MRQVRYYLPVILIVVLSVSFFRLGAFTLFDVDEAVFAEATREMVESGDWITPTYNGVNRYDKPVLFYWLMALSFKAFGVNEFGARFPSAAAGSLLSLLLYMFVRRHMGEPGALCAVMSFVISAYFAMYSHAAVTDMALALFISLALMNLYNYISSGGPENVGTDYRLLGFYAFSALAFLTKGLIGILFPFGIAFVYLAMIGGMSGPLRVLSLPGIVLFLTISLPWYAAAFSANGMEFIEQFFMKHHFLRYTGVISGHEGGWYYYLPALLAGLSPWVVYLPEGIINAWRQVRRAPQQAGGTQDSPLPGFALIWFSFIVLFFSFSTTKLPNYILPAIPAAAVLIASGITGQSERHIRISKIILALVSLSAAGGAVIARLYLPRFGITDTSWLLVLTGIFICGALLNIAGAARKKSYHLQGAVLAFLFLMLLSSKALPLANRYMQGTLHKYSLYAREHLGEEGSLILYKFANKPSIVFYSRHKITIVDNAPPPAGPGLPDQLDELIKTHPRIMVISKALDSETVEKKGLKLVEKDNAYALFENK